MQQARTREISKVEIILARKTSFVEQESWGLGSNLELF